ncbi:hypothetical protein [Spirosoma panaciterrae]|uniref:hypothetical protein n=1 Tax=Spirosoma panaciterrae TaxID=496058 RepID=UPI00036DB48D|nr:hypothetical protein [Spirosoma panaciterrae]
MPTPVTTKTTPKRKRKIPDYLVYEVMDGKPIYYKGYQSVLNKTKTLEDIMGCSSLQAELVSYLLRIIFRVFDEKKYRVLTNEIGSHIDIRNNLSNDIAIYDKAVLTADKINKKYPDVPPKIAIEIDTEADTSELTGFGYTYKKSKKLLDFGVERIIWIMIGTKTVTVMEPNRDWQVREWDTDIELMDGHTFNIARYLAEEGIVVDD